MFGGGRSRGWNYTAGGEWFTTDGYIAVAEEQEPGIATRGPIDSPIASKHESGVASIGYQAGNGWRFDITGSVFTDDRLNGTPAVITDPTPVTAAGRLRRCRCTGRRAALFPRIRRHSGLRPDVFVGVAQPDERGSQSTATSARRGSAGPRRSGPGQPDGTPCSSEPKPSSSKERRRRRSLWPGAC